MFDDVQKEPEDMFDATDKVAPQLTPPTDAPLPPAPPPAPRVALATDAASPPAVEERMEEVVQKRGGFPWKAIILVIGILVVIAAAFFLSIKILGSRTPLTPQPPSNEVVDDVKEVAPGFSAEGGSASGGSLGESAESDEEEEPVVSRTDTDKDGLTDTEEAELGTSARAADTDGDELFDLEEVRTWETDPLNPDTDGDGYLDGAEVKAGYNPNGEGVLQEAPTESS